MATLYFTGSSSDWNATGAFKDVSSGTNAAPANNDTIFFDSRAGSTAITTNTNTGLTNTVLYVEQSFAGKIGDYTAAYTAAGSRVAIGAATVHIGRQTGGPTTGTGSNYVAFDFGASGPTVNIYDSASTSSIPTLPPVLICGGTAMTVNMKGGNVGVAARPNDAASGTFRVVKDNPAVRPQLFLGGGSTLTALTATTGSITSRSDNTAVSVALDGDASYTSTGTGAHTTLTVDGGTATYSGTGTITTLNLTGTFDRSRDGRALTITTTNLYKGAILDLNNGVASSTTRTNKNLVRCSQEDVTIRMPAGEVF